MLCYKDMTFCAAECQTRTCFRNYNSEVEEGARKWWSHDPENAPIAFSDFSEVCQDFTSPPETNTRD